MKQSGNPTFKPDFFKTPLALGEEVMTVNGTYMKTAILLSLCLLTASYSWGSTNPVILWGGVIGGLVFALITMFKKTWAPLTAPVYALFEGLVLGAISSMYQSQYPGIVSNAIMLTFAVMAVMLLIFSYQIIKVTDQVRTIIFASTGAIFLVYLVSFVMGFFGTEIPMIHGAGPIGIGFSVVVVGIASFNLLLDFDFIERAASSGQSPKYMEWYGAFGLVVTLIWLYLEILRLLSKLNRK